MSSSPAASVAAAPTHNKATAAQFLAALDLAADRFTSRRSYCCADLARVYLSSFWAALS